MWRHVASNFLTVAILLLMAAGAGVAWGQRQYVSAGPLAQAICLRVESGSNFGRVADDLVARGAVSSGYILKVGADYEGLSSQLKAGSYLVTPGSTMQDIVKAVTTSGQSTCGTEVNFRIGVTATDVIVRELDPAAQTFTEIADFDPVKAPPAEYVALADDPAVRWRVTVAEGTTAWQVVEGLKLADFLEGEVAELPPEGMLAPDSYEVARGSARGDLVAEMGKRQAVLIADLWPKRAEGLPYKTPEEAMVMASIIEKETGVPEERGKVASVFLNRLEQGMKLQTDPTVIYGVTKGQGILGRGLRQSELRRDTPYNTYVIDGLPPGPIANPGRDSIAAALNPEKTEYLFFVADGSGGHAFAETLAQHNENVKKWREIEAQAGGTQDGGN
jgi:UPF0755 protein